jgi:hypothetical protein
MEIPKVALLLFLVVLGFWLVNSTRFMERFANILPTGMIDQEFVSPNEDPLAYYDASSNQTYQRVGGGGVDMNCNDVELRSIIHWIRWNDPAVLNRYVLRDDPSANIDNPNDAPRILKSLLRNLPSQHKYVPILQKCYPVNVRV